MTMKMTMTMTVMTVSVTKIMETLLPLLLLLKTTVQCGRLLVDQAWVKDYDNYNDNYYDNDSEDNSDNDSDNVSPVGARGHTQAQASGGAPAWSCVDTHYWESGHNAPLAGQQHSPRPGGTLLVVTL